MIKVAQNLGCSDECLSFLKDQKKKNPTNPEWKKLARISPDKKLYEEFIYKWINEDKKMQFILTQLNFLNVTSDLRREWRNVSKELGINATQFCKEVGIPTSSFNDWLHEKYKTNIHEPKIAEWVAEKLLKTSTKKSEMVNLDD